MSKTAHFFLNFFEELMKDYISIRTIDFILSISWSRSMPIHPNFSKFMDFEKKSFKAYELDFPTTWITLISLNLFVFTRIQERTNTINTERTNMDVVMYVSGNSIHKPAITYESSNKLFRIASLTVCIFSGTNFANIDLDMIWKPVEDIKVSKVVA